MKVLYYLECNDVQYHILGAYAVAQTRRVMPGVEIVQLGGPNTVALPGVDRVYRMDAQPSAMFASRCPPIAPNRAKQIAMFLESEPETEALCLDVDTLVLEDVSDVFKQPFDIAVSKRHFTDGFLPTKPYNSGVVFTRASKFWTLLDNAEEEAGRPAHDRVFCSIVDSADIKVLRLDGAQYNYIPHQHECAFTGRKIVHFTGSRKAWMKDYCMLQALIKDLTT